MMPRQSACRPGPPAVGWVKKCSFSAATCLLVFTAVELGLRTAHGWGRHWVDCHRWHPVLGWCLRENWTGRWGWTGGKARINPQGIRDDQTVGPKAPGENRLLILGDSLTFGARVKTSEAYPQCLERCLRDDGCPWRVLNGGVTSYDPAQEADWLELFGWKLEPDVLAIGFCRNDVEPSDRNRLIHPGQRSMGEAERWLTEHSITVYQLQRGLWYAQARLASATPARVDVPSGQTLSGWPFVEQSYRRLARLAREKRVPVILIVFPTLDNLTGQTPDDLSEHLQALGQELGWSVADLRPAFQGEDAASLFLPEDPIHPNAAGYERAARSLAQAMCERHLLP